MPDLDWNRRLWEAPGVWSDVNNGDAWSGAWGSPEAQWFWTLLPRISPYVPAASILEIAPGFGRWTQWLKSLCERLTIVDLSETCIEACRTRFAADTHISYHVTDGKSLAMVADASVDFAFSFDSLVHAEIDVLQNYVEQLSRKLTTDGVAFLHHSNQGEYASAIARAERVPMGKRTLERWGWIERNPGDRALSVTAGAVAEAVKAGGMKCICQEIIDWGHSRRLTDCISVFTPARSQRATNHRILRNPGFMAEARRAATLSGYYAEQGAVRKPSAS